MELHTVQETARLLNVSNATVYNYIHTHKLEAVIGGDRKKEGQRGTAYRISDEAISEFRRKYMGEIAGSNASKEIYDKGHVLSAILDYNMMGINNYVKMRKYGGFAYVNSIFSGYTEVTKQFIKEFSSFFDILESELEAAIRSQKVKLVKLREQYDIPENHSTPAEKLAADLTPVPEKEKQEHDVLAAKYSQIKEIQTVYYISKSKQSTDNPEESEEVPVMPMTMFRSIEDAKKYLNDYRTVCKSAFVSSPDENTVILTKVNEETLKIDRVILRIKTATLK